MDTSLILWATVPLTVGIGLIAGWNLGMRNYGLGIFWLTLFAAAFTLNLSMILS